MRNVVAPPIPKAPCCQIAFDLCAEPRAKIDSETYEGSIPQPSSRKTAVRRLLDRAGASAWKNSILAARASSASPRPENKLAAASRAVANGTAASWPNRTRAARSTKASCMLVTFSISLKSYEPLVVISPKLCTLSRTGG